MAKAYKRKYFSDMLEVMLNEAEINGQQSIDIKAGDLHNRVVREAGVSRVPMTCSAMRRKTKEIMSDGKPRGEIVSEPPKKDGHAATYKFRVGD